MDPNQLEPLMSGIEKKSSPPSNLPGLDMADGSGAPAGSSPQLPDQAMQKPSEAPGQSEQSDASLSEALEASLGQDLEAFEKGSSNKGVFVKILFAVIALGLLGVIVFGGVYVVRRFITSNPKQVETVKQAISDVIEDPDVDVDADGLTNQQEADNKSNYQMADTDGDGLKDGEEVNKYKSDPTKKDTDADTFSDGDEVRNGFNPKGPGKL